MRKIAIGAAVVLLIAAAAATAYSRTRHSPGAQLSTADARAAMLAVNVRDIGWRSTAGQQGPLGSECRGRLHGSAVGGYRVSLWVCDSAAQAQGIADTFPASMPGLPAVPRTPGIDVSAQDNVLVLVAAPRPSLAYDTAEHLRELLGGSERSS